MVPSGHDRDESKVLRGKRCRQTYIALCLSRVEEGEGGREGGREGRREGGREGERERARDLVILQPPHTCAFLVVASLIWSASNPQQAHRSRPRESEWISKKRHSNPAALSTCPSSNVTHACAIVA